MWKWVVDPNFSGSAPLTHTLLESSTTKLLLRLFDPDEGQILIDDLPISEYRSEELRRAMSVLWQDYHTYPLSVRILVFSLQFSSDF